jgi:hypothetical protein
LSSSCDLQYGCYWDIFNDGDDDDGSENSGISAGAIAGIVIGLLIVTGIFIYIYIKKPCKRSMDGNSSADASVRDEPGIKDVEKADSSSASEDSMKDTEDERGNFPYENTDYEEPEISYMESEIAYESMEKAPARGEEGKVKGKQGKTKGKGKASGKAKGKGNESNNLDNAPEVPLARYESPDMIKPKTAPPPGLARDSGAGLSQPVIRRHPSPKHARTSPTGTKAQLHGTPASPDRVSDPIGMELYSNPQGNKRVRSCTTKTSPDGSRVEVIEYTDGSKVTKIFTVSS